MIAAVNDADTLTAMTDEDSPLMTLSQLPIAQTRGRALLGLWLLCLLALGLPATAEARPAPGVKVHAHTLQHRTVDEALALVRPLLSAHGAVEEQRSRNTLVFRDTVPVIHRIKETLAGFDRPPQQLRLEIQMVKAGPKERNLISPPTAGQVAVAELPEDLEKRLKSLLRYEDYHVLAHAGVSSKEGDAVTYSLGERYDVSFKLGAVMAGRRLKLEGFEVIKKNPVTNKGRQVPPRKLFHSTLNLWLEKPFALVLTQDDSRQEALMVAISCYYDDLEDDPESTQP